MDDGSIKAFSEKERSLIIAPAGCGKTEIIAKSVSYSSGSNEKQLILTHTHAGVKSIHDRLRKLGVPKKHYYIDTIAGFALQYATAFPLSSGLGIDFDPTTNDWNKVYAAANAVISHYRKSHYEAGESGSIFQRWTSFLSCLSDC